MDPIHTYVIAYSIVRGSGLGTKTDREMCHLHLHARTAADARTQAEVALRIDDGNRHTSRVRIEEIAAASAHLTDKNKIPWCADCAKEPT